MPTPTTLPDIPAYLSDTYTWAYVTPQAVRRFERQWLVNLILWGNFARLRDLALASFGEAMTGHSLQVACVYGDLTARWLARHATDGQLDVIDVLPVQIDNLKRKLGHATPVRMQLADSAALPFETASYDRALLFFLLHEQPAEIRQATLSEVFRVLRPGGKLVIVDYHRPSPAHPLRLPMQAILATLEPFALDLWHHDITAWFPPDLQPASVSKRTIFGGLYQIVEVIR